MTLIGDIANRPRTPQHILHSSASITLRLKVPPNSGDTLGDIRHQLRAYLACHGGLRYALKLKPYARLSAIRSPRGGDALPFLVLLGFEIEVLNRVARIPLYLPCNRDAFDVISSHVHLVFSAVDKRTICKNSQQFSTRPAATLLSTRQCTKPEARPHMYQSSTCIAQEVEKSSAQTYRLSQG